VINNVRDYVRARLGVPTETRASAAGAVMGVAAARILPQDPARIVFTLINLSANEIFITPVGVPAALYGIRLGPNGGTVTVSADEDGEVVAWEWLGIATAINSNYLALETLIGRGPQG
jgi:hypothetical protein